MSLELELLRKEFRFFIDEKVGKYIVERRGRVPVNFTHEFSIANLSLPIPSKDKKWIIGNTLLKNLDEIDRKLNEMIIYHYAHDFDGFEFYCYIENGKIVFEAYLPFIDEN